MRKFLAITFFITSMMLGQASASAPTAPQDGKIMIDAATKFLDGTTAHLKGNKKVSDKAFNDAIALYDSVLSKEPTNVTALNARGVSKNYIQAGSGNEDLKLAIALSTQAIETNSNDAQAYYNRATSYRAKKMFDEAKQDYQMAIKLNPEKKSWTADLKATEAEAAKETAETPKAPAEAEKPKAN